jgi:hypothetical protein
MILVALGALEALSAATQLLAWLGGWADPFYWRMRQSMPRPGLPSSLALTAASAMEFTAGLLALVGGLAAATRRPWARGLLFAYAVTQIAARTTATAARMTPMLSLSTPSPEILVALFGFLATLLVSIGLPLVLLVLVQRPEPWRTT